MNIDFIKKGALEYIVIDKFYTKKELDLIYKELNLLFPHAQTAAHTNAAKDENNITKKNCLGVFLDDFYDNERAKSSILEFNRKIFNIKLVEKLAIFNAYFKHMNYCNADYTLINYYKDSEHYLPHHDKSILTAITTFQIGNFEGGDFCFTEYNEAIKYKENRCIIFTGCLEHEAKPIAADKNSYRISMAQFLNYR